MKRLEIVKGLMEDIYSVYPPDSITIKENPLMSWDKAMLLDGCLHVPSIYPFVFYYQKDWDLAIKEACDIALNRIQHRIDKVAAKYSSKVDERIDILLEREDTRTIPYPDEASVITKEMFNKIKPSIGEGLKDFHKRINLAGIAAAKAGLSMRDFILMYNKNT